MKIVLRWLAILPAYYLAYAVSRIIWTFSAYPFVPDLIDSLNRNRDFGTFTIWGPIYVFCSQASSAAAAIFAASMIAPQGRERHAQYITAGFWGVILVLSLVTMHSHPYPFAAAFRIYVAMGAEAFGILTVCFSRSKSPTQ